VGGGLKQLTSEEPAVEEEQGDEYRRRNEGERERELVEGEPVAAPENRPEGHHRSLTTELGKRLPFAPFETPVLMVWAEHANRDEGPEKGDVADRAVGQQVGEAPQGEPHVHRMASDPEHPPGLDLGRHHAGRTRCGEELEEQKEAAEDEHRRDDPLAPERQLPEDRSEMAVLPPQHRGRAEGQEGNQRIQATKRPLADLRHQAAPDWILRQAEVGHHEQGGERHYQCKSHGEEYSAPLVEPDARYEISGKKRLLNPIVVDGVVSDR